MFKKLSIVTLSVMGILLVAGCSNQSNSSTDTKPKTENTTKKDSDSSNKSTDTSDKTTDTNTNDNKTTDNNNTNNDATNNNSDNDNATNNNNTDNQPTNITSGDQAMEYLMGKLTIDKTGVSALYNGTVTDDAGKPTFRINLYHSGDASPFSAYNVYSDGTYTQVW